MRLPELNKIKKSTVVVDEFLGYNNSLRISDKEFSDDLNMSCENYPILSPRAARNKVELYEASFSRDGIENDIYDYDQSVLCSGDKVAYLVGPNLFYDGVLVSTNFATGKNDTLTYMNGRLVTFPAGKVYDIGTNVASSIGVKQVVENESSYNFEDSSEFSRQTNFGAFKSGKKITKTVAFEKSEFTNPGIIFAAAVSGTKNITVEVESFNSKYLTCVSVEYSRYESSNEKIYLAFSFTTKKEHKSTGYLTISGSLKFKGNTCTDASNYVEAYICDNSFEKLTDITVGTEAPSDPKDGACWLDTSDESKTLKKWSSSSQMWAQVLSAYYRFQFHNVSLLSDFKAEDTVDIECDVSEVNGPWDIQSIGSNYFVINAVLSSDAFMFTGNFTISRYCPNLKYACEIDNRIWGVDVENNEIRACALGDPWNWKKYAEALSTDSYSLKVASEGPFTAIYPFGGAILCFKENYIHKIYGTKPTNYALRTTKSYGVEEGSYDSLAVVNGVLYYKGKYGVYAYSGSVPELISKFGDDVYINGHAGCHKDNYYINLTDTKSNNVVFTYNTKYGIWHKESAAGIESNMIEYCGNLLYITKDMTKTIKNGYKRLGSTLIKDCSSQNIDVVALLKKNTVYRVSSRYKILAIKGKYSKGERTLTFNLSQSDNLYHADFTTLDDYTSVVATISQSDYRKAALYPVFLVENEVYAANSIECDITTGSSGIKTCVPRPIEDAFIGVEDYEPLKTYEPFTEGDDNVDTTVLYYDAERFIHYFYDATYKKLIDCSSKTLVDSHYFTNQEIYVQHYEPIEHVDMTVYLNSIDPFEEENISEGTFNWKADTGVIGLSLADKKWISRIIVRAYVASSAVLKVYTEYDSSGIWDKIYERNGTMQLNTISLPIIPRRCDHMKIRFEGSGIVKLYSISKEVEIGSEM